MWAFLDEATASLDPEYEVLIQQAISALVADKTVIVIAHRIQSISNADQIIILDNGRIAEAGMHDEQLKRRASMLVYGRSSAAQAVGIWLQGRCESRKRRSSLQVKAFAKDSV